jgi:hypothetical protein
MLPPTVQRILLRWRTAGLLALLLLAGLIFAARTFWPARLAVINGFPAYYTVGQLVASGRWSPSVYDDVWFGDQVESFTQNGVREIYAFNPPLFPIFFALFAGLDLATAREVWAWLNLFMLLTALWLILKALSSYRGMTWRVASAGFALLAAPVHDHFRFGQVYILLLLLFALAFWLSQRGHSTLAGVALGVPLAVKLSGLPLWLALLAHGQRRLNVSTVLTAGLLGLGGLAIMGLPTWLAFLQSALAGLSNYPQIALTGYQSISSLFHHLFVYDALWNPEPIWVQPWLAPLLTWSIFISAIAVTMRRASQSVFDLAFAAGLTATVILLPFAEEYHYVLLILPITVMLARVLQPSYRFSDLVWLMIILFLIGAPLRYQAPELTRSWLALLAYPRPYGGWLLWLWFMRRMNVERSSL